jgi:hypothetical protein
MKTSDIFTSIRRLQDEKRQQKEGIVQRTMAQQRHYQELDEQRLQESLRREAKLAQQYRNDYKDRLALYQKVYGQIARERLYQRKQKHVHQCHEIVSQLVAYAAEVRIPYSSLNSKLTMASFW